MTKLGRLVKAGKIKSMEEIYLHSLPIKEYQIVDWFLPNLKDEVMKVRFSPFSYGSARLGWRAETGPLSEGLSCVADFLPREAGFTKC